MMLRDSLERQGNRLFLRRSYLPIGLAPVLAWMLADVSRPESAAARVTGGWWDGICAGVAVAGLAVRVLAVGFAPAGTSGRQVRRQQALRVNTTGLYSVVRHPIYLGNFLMLLGVTFLPGVPWFGCISFLVYALAYERIAFAEEAYLDREFGSVYRSWAERTPAFVPKIRLWRPPDLPFSVRSVLRREYPAVLALAAAFALMKLAVSIATGRGLRLEPLWMVLLGIGAGVFVSLRTLKRHTRILHAPGR
jgi:protein-S-isoprenylcysteine O-methyltransferase Ste14